MIATPRWGGGTWFSEAVGIVALFLMVADAGAQQIPSQIERDTPRVAVPQLDLVMPSFSVDVQGGVAPKPGTGEETVPFEGVRVTGASVYPAELLSDDARDLQGREIRLDELFGIAASIQSKYLEDGYFLSFAFIPPQSVEDGVYEVRVVEGYISTITIEGGSHSQRVAVRRMLDSLTAQRPARLASVERALLLVNDMNGISVSGTLRPAEEGTGASDLLISLEHTRFEIAAEADNRASKYTGPWEFFVEAGANSLLVVGDALRTELLVSKTIREQRYGGLEYETPVLDTGVLLKFTASASFSDPGYDLDQFKTHLKSFQGGIAVSYPLIRRRRFSMDLGLGYRSSNLRVEFDNDEVYFDKLRTFEVALEAEESGFLNGYTGMIFRFLHNADIFDSSNADKDTVSRGDASQTARRMMIDIARLQPMVGDASLLLETAGQFAFDGLASSQEFAVGGQRFGRAFDIGEITGDHGLAATAELRYDSLVDAYGLEALQPYAFYDFGITWDQDKSESDRRDTLTSTGFGLRARSSFGLTTYIEYAKPLTRARATEAEGGREPRVLVGTRFELGF